MTTTTADKGEQECREAFEQEFRSCDLSRHSEGSTFAGEYREYGVQMMWDGYQAAWKHRPTNEGQDGLTDSEIIELADKHGVRRANRIENHLGFARAVEKLAIARHLSSHPTPDDQQAKDAALLRDLLEEARDDVCECLNQMMVLAGYPSGDKKIARQREFLARIDAALSTTKQEEVLPWSKEDHEAAVRRMYLQEDQP